MLRAVGDDLAARLTETVHRLQLDNRELPMDRAHDEEVDLAGLLLAAAWYEVNYRNLDRFRLHPAGRHRAREPRRLHPRAAPGTAAPRHGGRRRRPALQGRRRATERLAGPYAAGDCTPGPTFPNVRIAADADLAVDGLLLDFKSIRYTRTIRQADAWQLAGYLLLDTDDRHRIHALGLYLSRSSTLAGCPFEPQLRTQPTAAPNHLGSRLSRSC